MRNRIVWRGVPSLRTACWKDELNLILMKDFGVERLSVSPIFDMRAGRCFWGSKEGSRVKGFSWACFFEGNEESKLQVLRFAWMLYHSFPCIFQDDSSPQPIIIIIRIKASLSLKLHSSRRPALPSPLDFSTLNSQLQAPPLILTASLKISFFSASIASCIISVNRLAWVSIVVRLFVSLDGFF